VIITKLAALVDPNYAWAKDFDWDSLGLCYDGQLAHTRDLITGDAFSNSLDAIISAAKAKLGSELVIMLLN
jgi:hypothetical protein